MGEVGGFNCVFPTHLAAALRVLNAMLPQVVLTHHAAVEPAVLDSICASLHKAGLQERAGDLYLHLGRQEEALAAYRKGHAYRCVCLTTHVAGLCTPAA